MSLLVLVGDTVTGKIRGWGPLVSVVTANGISGTVNNEGKTAAITLDISGAINEAVASLEGQLAAAVADLTEDIDEAIQSGRWEPLTNGNEASPEILFSNGDVLMTFVQD